MSESNVGGRSNKSSINHISFINGIVHDHLSSVKKPPIVIQQYKITKMIDGMNLKEALSDTFNTGDEDETLHLLYKANKSVGERMKTSFRRRCIWTRWSSRERSGPSSPPTRWILPARR